MHTELPSVQNQLMLVLLLYEKENYMTGIGLFDYGSPVAGFMKGG